MAPKTHKSAQVLLIKFISLHQSTLIDRFPLSAARWADRVLVYPLPDAVQVVHVPAEPVLDRTRICDVVRLAQRTRRAEVRLADAADVCLELVSRHIHRIELRDNVLRCLHLCALRRCMRLAGVPPQRARRLLSWSVGFL